MKTSRTKAVTRLPSALLRRKPYIPHEFKKFNALRKFAGVYPVELSRSQQEEMCLKHLESSASYDTDKEERGQGM